MIYLITFLEGFISFISPCMLPMLPIYLAYFAGGKEDNKKNTLLNSIAFVLGFTTIFCILGVFASTIGLILNKYQTVVNIICGLIVILFGLNYVGIIKVEIFKVRNNKKNKITGFFSAFLFGIIFSVNFTPCVGAFLGSALMMASSSGTIIKGLLLLLTYSLGLGIPIIMSSILITRLTNVFKIIKENYKVINFICGSFLIIIGILIMLGIMNKLLYFFV